ncbi:hypothetical protein AB4344_00640, partial [Vibrio breoganii]
VYEVHSSTSNQVAKLTMPLQASSYQAFLWGNIKGAQMSSFIYWFFDIELEPLAKSHVTFN